MGWIEKGNGEDVLGANACYEQLDARDEMVLTKGLWCEYKFGLTRAQAESSIGVRRERIQYVESLAQICQEGLRDLSHFPNPQAGVCVSFPFWFVAGRRDRFLTSRMGLMKFIVDGERQAFGGR